MKKIALGVAVALSLTLNINFEENLKLSLGIDSNQLYNLSANHILQAFNIKK
jgi:hypothetical protein